MTREQRRELYDKADKVKPFAKKEWTMNKTQIIDHIMSTPYNINWNVLSTMLGDGDWSKLKAYVEQTPHNMNRKVLEVFLGSDPRVAVVGTAIVGQDVVG